MFNGKVEELLRTGMCIFKASVAAYAEVSDIFDPPYGMDTFVAKYAEFKAKQSNGSLSVEGRGTSASNRVAC